MTFRNPHDPSRTEALFASIQGGLLFGAQRQLGGPLLLTDFERQWQFTKFAVTVVDYDFLKGALPDSAYSPM